MVNMERTGFQHVEDGGNVVGLRNFEGNMLLGFCTVKELCV